MEDDLKPPGKTDSSVSAKDVVQVGPIPEWAVPCPADFGHKAKEGDQFTYLLLEQQLHAERRQSFIRGLARLETIAAVQSYSQWRVEFEPRTQSLLVHSVKIHRGGVEIEHANVDKMRILQRESGLDRLVIDGWLTLLLLLEDVRPGDVLEWSYSLATRPRLMPEHCGNIFSVHAGLSTAKFRHSVIFNETRGMKWKSSSAGLQPVEARQNGEVSWVWEASHEASKPEPCTPSSQLTYPWMQVSDCPDWETLARAVTKTWGELTDDTGVAEIARDIAAEPDLSQRVEKILRLVQDDIRYLSVNLELGGQIPAAPGIVAKRRYGDCKDMSFLLARLLHEIGVVARPVLVNAALKGSVANMLPMPGAFDHVIVEYELEGMKRWVDPTAKFQGGGPLNRFVPHYGVGLPIGGVPSGLVEPPSTGPRNDSYVLNETLLLDTTGQPSLLAVTIHAAGYHAETMQRKLLLEGEEAFGQDRLKIHGQRFREVKRSGALTHKYDRETNEFLLSEVLEINRFLLQDRTPGFCQFSVVNNMVASSFALPEKGDRKWPFAVPYPCNIAHNIEVQSATIKPGNSARRKLDTPFFQFSSHRRFLNGSWFINLSMKTLVDVVPVSRLGEYRTAVEEVRDESNIALRIPIGASRPRQRRDFGTLPAQRRPIAPNPAPPPENIPVVEPPPPENVSSPSPQSLAQVAEPAPPDSEPRRHSHKSSRRSRAPKDKTKLMFALVAGAIVIIAFLMVWLVRAQSH